MDRPLSLAGKVCAAGETPFSPSVHIVDIKRPVAVIPNLAIHMNREVNSGVALNPQKDMLPILTLLGENTDKDHCLVNLLARETGCAPEEILDYDLCLYNLDSCSTLGLEDQFFCAPRIDNLTSVSACLAGIASGSLPSTTTRRSEAAPSREPSPLSRTGFWKNSTYPWAIPGNNT